MNYPVGSKINIGDDVVFDEGEAYGYVLEVLESELDYKRYGLDCPSLILGIVYPKSDWNFISYPQHILERESLRRQSIQEKYNLKKIIQAACILSNLEMEKNAIEDKLSFAIRYFSEDRESESWQVTVFRNQTYANSVIVKL